MESLKAVRDAGLQLQIRTLNYETAIDENDSRALESYLQRCAFDDSITLDEMLNSESLGEYLAGSNNNGVYCFQQSVDVLVFGEDLTFFKFWNQE